VRIWWCSSFWTVYEYYGWLHYIVLIFLQSCYTSSDHAVNGHSTSAEMLSMWYFNTNATQVCHPQKYFCLLFFFLAGYLFWPATKLKVAPGSHEISFWGKFRDDSGRVLLANVILWNDQMFLCISDFSRCTILNRMTNWLRCIDHSSVGAFMEQSRK
jgi:hypothetical protein